jgi:ketosteroid isomerase-like protein
MTKLIAALTFALTLPALSFAAPSDKDKEVLSALEGWRQATLHKDSAALDKVLHKDLTYTHSSGKEETKADQLKAVADPKTRIQSIELAHTTIRYYGNTAIVKTMGDITSAPNGTPATSHLILLHVFVKTPEGWQMVARQATKAGN